MIQKIILALFAFSTLTTHAKDDNSLFVKVTTNNKDNEIIVGDSTVFSVWIYSIYPIGELKCNNNGDIKIKDCHVRKVINHRRSQSRKYFNNTPYYCTLWAQYVVGSKKKGNYTFPSLDFSATLYLEQKQELDPFDPFGFFNKPTYKKQNKNVSSHSTKFSIVAEPEKSTQELIRSGKTVI